MKHPNTFKLLDPDRKVVFFSDGKPPLTERDLTVDDRQSMMRLSLGIDGSVTSHISAESIIDSIKFGHKIHPWGTFF